MYHTYEVWVDIKEYLEQMSDTCRSGATRYEINAETREVANDLAREQALSDYPRGSEYDVRVTRVLR